MSVIWRIWGEAIRVLYVFEQTLNLVIEVRDLVHVNEASARV
jgi:hypothetical protein